MRKKQRRDYSISIVGCGNVAYRLSISLKLAGYRINCICTRDINKAVKLSRILNKPEYTINSPEKTAATDNYLKVAESDVIILAVSDDAILPVARELSNYCNEKRSGPTVIHCSGSTEMSVLKMFQHYGVLYPLMTLSSTKPVDFSIIPFFLEANSIHTEEILTSICRSFSAEYKFATSEERGKLHVAAVYMSNFVNYLAALAYDISKPNYMFLMPLAIETVRKAFLYEHPSLIQTGPAIRGDTGVIGKHLALLSDYPEHKEVYEILTNKLLNNRKK
jgi:predicted short-subunit dehydrogenase-like oxidoreductase (DUF2520 family)